MISFVIFFIGGLVGLWLGAELIVQACQKIAEKLKLSETFVGLTLLSLGTNFPEIMISLTGALEKRSGLVTDDIILGNIIGAFMTNLTLILGFAGLLKVIKIDKQETIYNGLILIISSALFFFLSLDGNISFMDGAILLAFYLFYFFGLKRKNKSSSSKKQRKSIVGRQLTMPIVQLLFGLFVIATAAHSVLANSIKMAENFGVSQLLVGIILVGIGTSLPELVIAMSATFKGSGGLSLGNLIGSSIVHILVSLGSSSLISKWSISRNIVYFDIPYLMLVAVVVVLFLFTKGKLERKESILLLFLYFIYLGLKFSGW